MKDPHPNSWICPSCNKKHDKPHWKDHHQKEPGWKDKTHLGWDKDSNPDFEFVCESCGRELTYNPEQPETTLLECPKCKVEREGKYCNECGSFLKVKLKPLNYCSKCKAERVGIPAPLFCPDCKFEESRTILLRI